MDLTPDDDQIALQTATAGWCRDNIPLESARSRSGILWSQLVAMGWTTMTTPDLELSHATEALIFAELGRFLAPMALLSTAVAWRWIEAETDGDKKVALALPAADGVRLLDSVGAAHALGLFSSGVALVDVQGISSVPSLDLSTTIARVALPVAPRAVNDPRASLHLQLLSAAFAVGCADAARDMSASYAKLREQFERPIGWFQAIKHLCADMAVRCEVARAQLYFASCALDEGVTDADFLVAAAKRLADQAALENSRGNIQVHGGIGMTDEALPHLCLKRAHLLQFVAPANAGLLLAAE